MRGDSLRDFYAKTLAVLGLGLLAGAGAIVDYWPVNEEWPLLSEVAGLQADAPVLVQDLTRQIPAPAPARAARRPRPVTFTVSADLFNGIPPGSTAAPDVTLDPMPVPEDFLRVDPAMPASLLTASMSLAPAPVGGAGLDDSRRPFGNAIRRTRESLAAARLFLGDTFSGVVGAFRKVSPFFATSAVGPVSH